MTSAAPTVTERDGDRCRCGRGVRDLLDIDECGRASPNGTNCAATSTGLGGRNLEMRDRGLAIDEVLVILGVEHSGLDVGSREPNDGSP